MSTLDQPSRWLSKARPAAALAAILTTVVVAVTSILAVATTTAAPMLHPQTRVVGIGLSAGKIVGPNETALRGGSRSSVMLVPGPLIVATTRDGAFGSHDYDLATSNAQSRPAQVALTQGGVALRSVRSAPDAHDVSARSASCVAAEGGFATAPDQAVFWSGIKGGDQTAAAWAADNGGTTLEMTPGGSSLPPWDASNPAVVNAWRQASAEFAQGASGNVTVLQDTTVRVNSVWAEVEYPALTSNPNVTSITAINPETRTSTVLWKRP